MKYKANYFRYKRERDALLALLYQCIDDMKNANRVESINKQGLIREEEARDILSKEI
jgi:hypothetical protein